MSDELTLKLSSPLTEEEMDLIMDYDLDRTSRIWFRTKHGKNVEFVKAIRCKDCKHRETENGFCEGRGWPIQLVPDDGFCDKGERKEHE